jgi:hypothetical protein
MGYIPRMEKKTTMSISVSPTVLARIDKARGHISRSTWVLIAIDQFIRSPLARSPRKPGRREK